MSENVKSEAKTIIEKIKRILFNCDLTIAYAKGEINLRNSIMSLYEGDMRKKSQQKFIRAKIEKERFELFVDEVEHTKTEIKENLNLIFDKYQPKYRQVFLLFFLEDKSYQEIAEQTNYSFEMIKLVIRRLKNDLITLYLP